VLDLGVTVPPGSEPYGDHVLAVSMANWKYPLVAR
jgi:hypothetical protein